MKQLIGWMRLGVLTVVSIALYGAHRQTDKTEATHDHHLRRPDRQHGLRGELVLLDLDGTVIAREVNLTPHAA